MEVCLRKEKKKKIDESSEESTIQWFPESKKDKDLTIFHVVLDHKPLIYSLFQQKQWPPQLCHSDPVYSQGSIGEVPAQETFLPKGIITRSAKCPNKLGLSVVALGTPLGPAERGFLPMSQRLTSLIILHWKAFSLRLLLCFPKKSRRISEKFWVLKWLLFIPAAA